jgi:hypothetical protein
VRSIFSFGWSEKVLETSFFLPCLSKNIPSTSSPEYSFCTVQICLWYFQIVQNTNALACQKMTLNLETCHTFQNFSNF